MRELFLDEQEIRLILNFLPKAGSEVPKDLDPTFYHTLTYDGDIRVQKDVNALIEKLTE